MKKFISIVLIASSMGCSTSSCQAILNNPATITTIENGVQTILTIAQFIFGTVIPLLTPAQQVTATAEYNDGVSAVTHAEATLDGALSAGDAPSVTAAIVALQQAASQLVQTITAIKAMVAAGAKPTATLDSAFTDLLLEQKTINSYKTSK